MRATTFEDYRARVLRVLLHIQQHLDDTVDLAELADIAAFSPITSIVSFEAWSASPWGAICDGYGSSAPRWS